MNGDKDNASVMSDFHFKMMNIHEDGRPIFARDIEKHLNPGAAQYKPENFDRYDKRTKPSIPCIPNEARWKESEESPGPGKYR